jgi:hypothetical protein
VMTPGQMVNELIRGLDGPHAGEHTTAAAWLAAEAIRYLNYATGTHASQGLTEPATACTVLGQLAEAAARLPQACAQLAAWRGAGHAAGRLGDDHGGPVPVLAGRARAHLDAAAYLADRLAAELAAAQSATATLHAAGGEDR